MTQPFFSEVYEGEWGPVFMSDSGRGVVFHSSGWMVEVARQGGDDVCGAPHASLPHVCALAPNHDGPHLGFDPEGLIVLNLRKLPKT